MEGIMFTIYQATNKINGKCYIGFDCNYPHRKAAHKCAVKRGSTLIFHNAIRSYGWDNFEWSILEQSEDGEKLLSEREEFYIRQFNSHYLDGGGYNMTYGGEATMGWVPSNETRKKISAANLGKKAWNNGKPSPWTSERNKKLKGSSCLAKRKTYKITDPLGQEYIVTGLKKFCSELKLNPGNMCSVAKGILNHYKQWKCELVESHKEN